MVFGRAEIHVIADPGHREPFPAEQRPGLMGQIRGPGAVPDLNGRVRQFGGDQGGLTGVRRRLGDWPRRCGRKGLLGTGSLLPGLRPRAGVHRAWRRGRRFGGQLSYGLFRGDRLSRGAIPGWNRG